MSIEIKPFLHPQVNSFVHYRIGHLQKRIKEIPEMKELGNFSDTECIQMTEFYNGLIQRFLSLPIGITMNELADMLNLDSFARTQLGIKS